MVLQLTAAAVMTQPVLSVTPDTPLQQAVQLISDHHISGLPVVDHAGVLIGELSEQDLMVRESGVDAGPYVMLLDMRCLHVSHCWAFVVGIHLRWQAQMSVKPARRAVK